MLSKCVGQLNEKKKIFFDYESTAAAAKNEY